DPRENPIEISKLLAQKAWVSSHCGLYEQACEAAQEAAPLLRRAGLEPEAERLLALTRGGGRLDRRVQGNRPALPFDHPIRYRALGLPTTPILADQLLCSVDHRIGTACENAGLVYTRFVDDLAVSGLFTLATQTCGIPALIERILADHGFAVNQDKNRFGRIP